MMTYAPFILQTSSTDTVVVHASGFVLHPGALCAVARLF
jgi:hypothetical protein